MNSVSLIGRLTRDPELRYIPGSGTAVSRFTIAVDRGYSRDKKSEMKANNQPTADFVNIVVWGKIAENCANYLVKGSLVGIQGKIQTGSYEKEGRRTYTTEVVGIEVQFLEWRNKEDDNSGFDDPWFSGLEGFHPADNDDIPF